MLKTLVFLLIVAQGALVGCSQLITYDQAHVSYLEGDYNKAFRLTGVLAHQGDPKSQYDLGYMYYHGLGAPRDKQLAIAWFEKSAENGFDKAVLALELLYSPSANQAINMRQSSFKPPIFIE